MITGGNGSIACFGEILWDILPDKELPGGAPMNVAYHLNKLAIEPILLTRIGNDDRGKVLLDLLERQNIGTRFIQKDPLISTGIVYASQDQTGDMSYEIVAPAAWDFIEQDASLEEVVRNSEFFIFGSLVARNTKSESTLFQLLEMAKNKVLDINLRPPHYRKALVSDLLRKASTVKMNREELQEIAGWLSTYSDIKDQIRLLQDHFNIPVLIVTKGGDGAIVNYEGRWFEHPGYTVSVVDTIGSGDAFLAAFLWQIIEGKSPDDALVLACGLGALVASRPGGWPAYEVNEIFQLIDQGQNRG